ncbi:LysR family transcriptional regulator [Mesorhizobium sp. B2-7-3]|nr:LysR family transcriptional regulator [Mesorhizobium sp. B2-7-3]
MTRRFYGLPALTTLAVFEAASRHLNFTLAARELNVTPGAVSRQIKQLETELGIQVFIRRGNGVHHTSVGADLFGAISSAFAKCSEAVTAAKAGRRDESVTLACTDSFATFWLTPRMADFWQRFPDISVNHLISDNVREFRRSEVDLRVRCGKGVWANETAELLSSEEIYPVCGKDFAARYEGIERTELSSLPLLDMDWTDPEWPSWDDFFRSAGIANPWMQRRRFGKYPLLMAAAEANQGLALGWDFMVRPLIKSGRLVRLSDLTVPAPIEYYVTWNSNRSLSNHVRTLKDWILQAA